MLELTHQLQLASEDAAIAAYEWYGSNKGKSADQAATDAMRKRLNKIDMHGIVAIGEGERDEAPMLHTGEEVGTLNGRKVDIAVDPLEGTRILVHGKAGALSVIAATERGGFLNAPDIYMDKIAIGFDHPEKILDLDKSVYQNLSAIADAKKCQISELRVMVLDRSRHENMISQIRDSGARVKLIQDGDIAGIIETTTGAVDVYMGIGGAPEGVLAAACLSVTGGQMCGRLVYKNKEERNRATKIGIKDLDKKYYRNDLVSGNVIFFATGVTDGDMLRGVRKSSNAIHTETLVMIKEGKIIQKVSAKRLI